MKSIFKQIPFIAISLLLIAIIFSTGFYIGNESSSFKNERVDASEVADLNQFWQVWNLLDEKFVAATTTQNTSSQDRIYGAIKGMVNSLDDPYTVFLTPAENESFSTTLQGNFFGIGMEVGVRSGVITVISPLKNSPAEKAGLLPGDIVISIDGTSTANLSLDDAVNLIRGEKGVDVELVVFREGEGNPITFVITRDIITIPNIETELRPDGIFVISLFNFNAESSNAFRDALREFLVSKTDKLVLDLRGNPGGFLDAAVNISSWFLPAGKVVVSESFGDNREDKEFRSKGFDIFNDNLRMAILINGGSASASEIVAGALREHKIADLVGSQSFGKGSVQELVDVSEGASLKVTIARWLTPNGNSISDGGLTPDFEVVVTQEDIDAGIDPQLNKAVEILLK